MSTSSVPPRKAPATPYQALHLDQGTANTHASPDPQSKSAPRNLVPRPRHLPRRQTAAQAEYYAAEASKIETLKNALFEALETSPAAAIPPQLIDLAHTYSNLLKIQLTIMPEPAPPTTSEPRPANTADAPAAYDPALMK